MSTIQQLPTWLEAVTLERWPTRLVQSADLHYQIGVPQAWQDTPKIENLPNEIEHTYAGTLSAELLSISYMAEADPKASMRTWVEAILAITGKPLLSPEVELLEWNYEGESEAAQQHLAVDEVHLYTGLGELEERGRPTLARLYFILARRGHQAWKIALSISTANLPGADESMIDRNDHIRAGAIFGNLALL